MSQPENGSNLHGRALKWVGVIMLIAVPLLATHEGEFWPFSIYPMFSQAGRPWERMLVRDVGVVPEDALWESKTLETVVGKPLALQPLDIPQNDFTKLVKTTKTWTADRVKVLRGMFETPLGRGQQLLVYRVGGDVSPEGRATTWATPVLLMRPDGSTEFHPTLAEATP